MHSNNTGKLRPRNRRPSYLLSTSILWRKAFAKHVWQVASICVQMCFQSFAKSSKKCANLWSYVWRLHNTNVKAGGPRVLTHCILVASRDVKFHSASSWDLDRNLPSDSVVRYDRYCCKNTQMASSDRKGIAVRMHKQMKCGDRVTPRKWSIYAT